MSAPDTSRSSAITDHPFEPGRNPYLCDYDYSLGNDEWKRCRLAEAAHAETTVDKEASK